MLTKTSHFLILGHVYTRDELRTAFGIGDGTINNGIFQPANHSSIWLFVTQFKTRDRIQYRDLLDGDTLTFESQRSARYDQRLTEHVENGTEVLLFYRLDKNEYSPGAGFRYEGPFDFVDRTNDEPAIFTLDRRTRLN